MTHVPSGFGPVLESEGIDFLEVFAGGVFKPAIQIVLQVGKNPPLKFYENVILGKVRLYYIMGASIIMSARTSLTCMPQ